MTCVVLSSIKLIFLSTKISKPSSWCSSCYSNSTSFGMFFSFTEGELLVSERTQVLRKDGVLCDFSMWVVGGHWISEAMFQWGDSVINVCLLVLWMTMSPYMLIPGITQERSTPLLSDISCTMTKCESHAFGTGSRRKATLINNLIR